MKKNFLLFGFLLFHFCLSAQESNLLNNQATQELNQTTTAPVRSDLDKTLDEAEKKLGSSIVGERVGAAKLLGKYPNARGTYLLLSGLDDESALVRRASIVSIIEHFDSGQSMYDRAIAEKVFSKIGDPDVEVRREISGMIPRLSIGLMRSGFERTLVNGRPVFRSVPGNLREDLLNMGLSALLDGDSIVRQNVLKHHTRIRLPLPASTLAQLLSDKDSAVVLSALDYIRIHAGDDSVLAKVEVLAQHPELGIRAKVISVTRSLAHSFPLYRGVLRKMIADESIEISAQAAVEIARLGETLPEDAVQRIEQYLMEARGLHGKVQTVFYGLSSLGDIGLKIYKKLTTHRSDKLRSQAWQRFLSLSRGWNKPEVWLPALLDRDEEVRTSVIVTLRGRLPSLDKKSVQELSSSKFSDVRAFAAESLLSAKPDVVASCFFDLLIDEDNLVRATTLRVLANLKTKGWEKIHQQSLMDEEYAIQRAAMDGLMMNRVAGEKILRDYLTRNPNTKIAHAIRAELNR